LYQFSDLLIGIDIRFYSFNRFIYFEWSKSDFYCRVKDWYFATFYMLSAWILAIIGFDRMLSIAYPTKWLFRKKIMFQYAVCLIFSFYNLWLLAYELVCHRADNRTDFVTPESNETVSYPDCHYIKSVKFKIICCF